MPATAADYRSRVHSPTWDVIDREQILTVTGHHPYVRLTTTGGGPVRGFVRRTSDGLAVVWLNDSRGRRGLDAWGDPAAVVRLIRALWAAGEVAGIRRLHLPRTSKELLTAHLPVGEPDHWDYRWTRSPLPPPPDPPSPVPLPPEREEEVRALLDRAFPDAYTRPGHPDIRRWYGLWHGDRLIACGADVSRGVGCLAGLAVDPDFRGRGLGAALTSGMAARLRAEFDVVSLGVMVDNHRAARLYHRLGFTEVAGRTSVPLHSDQ